MYFPEHRGADLLNESITLRVMDECGVDAKHLCCLHEASKHRQIFMARTENGEPLASLAFAKISRHTLKILADNTDHQLRSYEYREGKILYIIDGFFRKNSFRRAMEILAPELQKYRLIAYVKKGQLRILYNREKSIRLLKFPAAPINHTDFSTVAVTDQG